MLVYITGERLSCCFVLGFSLFLLMVIWFSSSPSIPPFSYASNETGNSVTVLDGIQANQAMPMNTTTTTTPLDGIQANQTLPFQGILKIPWTGLITSDLSTAVKSALGLDEDMPSVMVRSVHSGSPGELAGIRGTNMTKSVFGETVRVGGDIILSVDGNIEFARDRSSFLTYFYDNKKVGDTMNLTLLREGRILPVHLDIISFPNFFWHENSDFGFKILYPSDWRISQQDLNRYTVAKFLSSETRSSDGVSAAGVFIRISPASNLTLISLAQEQITEDETRRVLNIAPSKLGGLDAYEILYYDYGDPERTLKALSVYTINDDQVFSIDYAAEPEKYGDYIPLVRDMLGSFQFIY